MSLNITVARIRSGSEAAGGRVRSLGGDGADQPPGDVGRQQRIPPGHGSNTVQEHVRLGVFEEEPARPEAQGLVHVIVLVERREDHDPRPVQALLLQDLPRGLEPVHPGHPDVHQHDVGDELHGAAEGGLAVVGLAHHLDVRLGVEQRPKARPDQRLVVGEQDPDHAAPSSGSVARTRKPPSGRGPASSSPPSADARSRMPRIPLPPPVAFGAAAPRPSSSIWTVRSCGP